MFVPRTPGGQLTSMLRDTEVMFTVLTGDRVKFTEKAGIMLKNELCQNNPWSGQDCERANCLICYSGEEHHGDCRRRNVTYSNQCQQCLALGRDSVYYGESARSAFERGTEHARDRVAEKEDSHMHQHIIAEHFGEEGVKFKMKIEKVHRTAMYRQIHEAVLIKMNGHKNILNSKTEFNSCVLPEIAVRMGQFMVEEEEEAIEMGMKGRRRRKENEVLPGMPASKRRRRWKLDVGKRKENPLATMNIGMPLNKKRRIENFFQKSENKAHSAPSPNIIDYREGRFHSIAVTGHQKRENPGVSKINNIREMFQKLAEKEKHKKEKLEENNSESKKKEEEGRKLSGRKKVFENEIVPEVTNISTKDSKNQEFQSKLRFFKNKENKNFSSKGSSRKKKKKGVEKVANKMKITNFFAITQIGESKDSRRSSNPNLDAPTSIPGTPPKLHPNVDNKVNLSPGLNSFGNSVRLSPSRSVFEIRKSEIKPGRNEQNKLEDEIS